MFSSIISYNVLSVLIQGVLLELEGECYLINRDFYLVLENA